MRKNLFILLAVVLLTACSEGIFVDNTVKSPDGRIAVCLTDSGLNVSRDGNPVQFIRINVGKHDSFNCAFDNPVYFEYEMVSGKRKKISGTFNSIVVWVSDKSLIELRVQNDGLAYRFYQTKGDRMEVTYVIPDGQRRWAQTLKTDYEGFYPMQTESRRGKYGYPMLTQYGDNLFGLITESDVSGYMSATHLAVQESGEYRVEYMSNPVNDGDLILTPFNILILGSLADVVESTLVTDVIGRCSIEDTSWIEPGLSSWIYWANNHGSKDFKKVKEYIDLAAEMKWPYTLIDWEWDEMSNGGDINDALAYARSKGVKVNLWYNSGTSWIGPGAPGPQDRLVTADAREKEMTRLEQMGVTGIKVDFFQPDSAGMIQYYTDILKDAARHHLLVDFHGCTVPRGWNCAWPNLMSMEAVYGAEWYNNNPRMTNAAPAHNATLPFTRNVIGPMDYTPCTFSDSQHKHITTDCHELALPILFESGLQHMADRPESYRALPKTVKQLLMELPAAWDDTRLLYGYPGESAVIARRSGDRWFIAGINGTAEPMEVKPDFDRLDYDGIVTLFTDKGSEPGKGFDIKTGIRIPQTLTIPARGGFVMVTQSN